MKKGQAALEYLVTYGWAFLAILVVLGALAYFGLLTPARYLPARCEFGVQLECVDYVLEDSVSYSGLTLDRIRLQFRNNFGDDIEITDITPQEGEGIFNPPAGDPMRISQGNVSEIIHFYYNQFSPMLIEDEKQSVILTITFRRDSPGSPEHNVTGEIFATVQ